MAAKIKLFDILYGLSNDALNYFFPGYERKEEDHVIRGFSKEFDEVILSYQTEEWPTIEKERPTIRFSTARPAVDVNAYMAPEMPWFKQPVRPEEKDLSENTRELLAELRELKKRYGVSIAEIEAALSYTITFSSLKITRHNQIFLTDYDNREVKMDSLTKAVFFLFLRHPEGIFYKDLPDFRDELEEIYTSISGRSDMDAIHKSIEDLTSPVMSNSINEKVSKVKKAFRDVVDNRIASYYYIDGKQGAAKRISLNRSLVIWE